ncbi:restriction endonuclease [Burkholderia reimsis]|uniref:Restriction endonuclease n=1 Tax=Burkholderia reimsis TaxID=2234132 RepID=A0A365QTE4_9BURK|nr:restriction endonuclease [Burkholderia reimsis]RBB37277.1 restriction endonuclease [Burkholderia reimsis]
MGSIIFDPHTLADSLSETAGYKAGLTLSVEGLCDTLTGTSFPDTIRASETSAVRIRSEDYEDLFYALLDAIGFTEERYGGFAHDSAKLFHKYKKESLKEYEGALEIFTRLWPKITEEARSKGGSIDPSPIVLEAYHQFGKLGAQIAIEYIDVFDRALRLYPHSGPRYVEWAYALSLDGLFTGTDLPPEVGTYIDQRYINFLYKNPEKLGEMHWRKFEELTSEFFVREGFRVEIGPGSNDDGVDVRIWNADERKDNPPLCLVQCKRTKAKIEKVVVKGLYADVLFEEATQGLIVTTSELSPGARASITTRGYPIEEVNQEGVKTWLSALRVPGTGIVRV